jgi:L-iditol 2-dehydrogenase
MVRVASVGICGSDLHWFDEASIGDADLDVPLVLGHEIAGTVAGGPRNGLRVAVDPALPCESCTECTHGHPNLCQSQRFAGHPPQDGALREFMAWPSNRLIPVPESLSTADVAMLEPLGVAIHAVNLGKVRPGDTVGVMGCGPIGLLTLQVARAAGATNILAFDPLEHRRRAALDLGANEAAEPPSGCKFIGTSEVREVDVVFEAANDNQAVERAIECVRPGGTVVLIGIPADDRTAFAASAARRKGLTIKLVRRMKHTYTRAIDLVSRRAVDVRSIVTHRYPLERTLEAFETASRREGLKVLVEP